MKLQTAIVLASLLASPLAHSQGKPPGAPANPPTPPPAANPGAPGADPFVRQAVPPHGEVEQDWAPRHLSVCVEAFSLDMAEAALLQRRITDDAKLYEEILARVAKGTAAQEYFSVICARSGERATLDNVAEFIYPTEYMFDEGAKATTAPAATPSSGKPPADTASAASSPMPPLGTAFEMRKTGFSLEIEPTLGGNNEIIDLRISPQMVTLADRAKWGKGDSEIQMPEFETQSLTLALTVRPRKPVLMGTPSRPPVSKLDPDSAKKVWFSFVTVSVIKV